jgi:lycopene epsilon-cyclase
LQLSPIASETSVLDLVIIGCGPAGLSLAAESAKKGLTVGLIGPDLPFTNNYGVWEDEFKGSTLFATCLDNIFTRMIYVSLISFRSRSGELY